MKKIIIALAITLGCLLQTQKADAQLLILDIIKAGIKKVIRAVDLQIQRQQNKVIWLQDAQKTLENTLSKLKLQEISDWTQKQKDLYGKYFDELKKVKDLIAYYQRIKDITEKQARLAREYSLAWGLLRNDTHFTPQEITYMGRVYDGILSETVKNMDEVMLVAGSFRTQMTDAKRLEILNHAADRVDRNYSDLGAFTKQNAMLSLQRAHSEQEMQMVKKMYGLH
jgi:hypothetical protein